MDLRTRCTVEALMDARCTGMGSALALVGSTIDADVLADSLALAEELCEHWYSADSLALLDALCDALVLGDSSGTC